MNNDQIWIDENHKDSRYGLKGKLVVRKKTAYQEIIILKTFEYGNALMLDGCWMTSDRDEKYYHECLVHPALSNLSKINTVLIIGGGDGGTLRECLKYKDITAIDLVEIDEEVINLSKHFLKKVGGNSWLDKRLKINICDGCKWVKNIKNNYYDAILIDCSDPSDFANGLFSTNFYKECKRILKEKGILATQSESPESFKKIHIEIIQSLKSIFKTSSTMYAFVPFYPSGIWSWTFASSNEKDFLIPKHNQIKSIENSCDVWNLNYQEGALKMIPNKILKELFKQNTND
tara:strand:- start:1132 stop:1998 length:867 start_codon:yes stop_codon:yes gene_type:complete